MHLCTRILGDMGHTWDSGGTYISEPSSARAPAPAPPATRESGDHTYRDMDAHLENRALIIENSRGVRCECEEIV